MISPPIVVSDLDGTLLGHDDYQFEVTLPYIKQIHRLGGRLVLATSKTTAEVEVWRARLQLETPFIVENGSAIVSPDGVRLVLGETMPTLVEFLEPYADHVTTLTSCDVAEVVRLTGLTEAEAKLAKDRQYSIPFQLAHPELESQMRTEAALKGLRIIQGGRFLHLQGDCDKADAVARIMGDLSNQANSPFTQVCLGDSENDQSMLEAADIAVVVKARQGHLLKLRNKNTIYTSCVAPDGWCEGISQVLDRLTTLNREQTDG